MQSFLVVHTNRNSNNIKGREYQQFAYRMELNRKNLFVGGKKSER